MISENYFFTQSPERVALLADIHDRPCPGLIKSLKRNRPDIICISGDFIVGFHPDSDRAKKWMKKWRPEPKGRRPYAVEQIRYALRLLAACARIAPTFVSLGNHEWMLTDRELRFIESTGVKVLNNSWIRHGSLVIGGLTSAVVTEYRYYQKHPEAASKQSSGKNANPVFRFRKKHEWVEASKEGLPKIYPDRPYLPMSLRPGPDLAWLKDFEQQDGFKILLCHHPEYRDRYLKDMKIDLILSGHAHGGQIRFAGQGLFAPGQGLFPKYTSGMYGNLVVSRGLANTAGFIPRLGNPTEIVYLIPEK